MHIKRALSMLCTVVLLAGVFCMPVFAKSSTEIQEEIDEYESQLEDSETESDELAGQIDTCQGEVSDLVSEIEQQNIEMDKYRDAMMLRIKYFYEESPEDSIMEAMLGAESFSDLLNRLDYVQTLYDYDSDQLDEFAALITASEEKKDELNEKMDELQALLDEEEKLQEDLKSTISDKEEELEEAKAAEEAAAAAEQARQLMAAASGSSGGSYSDYSGDSGTVLTRRNGVVYYNGHRETWYSQRVLPGGGLSIPGRHVASDGTIRDADGYVCVASSDLAQGSTVETTHGTGKVYDSGCSSGTVDIYTDW